MTTRRIQMLRKFLGACALALVVAGISLPALAGVENPTDSAAVRAQRLDMALVKRLDAVAVATDGLDDPPELFLRTKANKVPKTLNELTAEIHTSPGMEAAIRAQGFTSRQYLLAAMAWVNAWFGYHLVKSGDDSARNLGIPPAHLHFVEQHYAELKAMQARR